MPGPCNLVIWHPVIVEATYGVSQHEPRAEREQRFLARLRQVVGRGGRVLLPVVALGRAQVLPRNKSRQKLFLYSPHQYQGFKNAHTACAAQGALPGPPAFHYFEETLTHPP